MGYVFWLVGGIAVFTIALVVYYTFLKDLFNFVLETNDDVEDFKETIEKENGS